MKLMTMKDGRVAVSDSVPRGRRDEGYPPPMLELRGPGDAGQWSEGDVYVGDEGVLCVTESQRRDGPSTSAILYADRRGIAGNTDSAIRRLHGWRGTTDGDAVYAGGWRRVESVTTYRGGLGWRVVLSADLAKDEE